MKKKTLFFACFCAFSLCTWKVQALNFEQHSIITMEDNVPTGYEVIVLQGTLMDMPNAVVAGANENSVYIHFNQSLGNINISIYNAANNLFEPNNYAS